MFFLISFNTPIHTDRWTLISARQTKNGLKARPQRMAPFHDRQIFWWTDRLTFLDGQIFGRTFSKKVLGGLKNKVLNGLFWASFWPIFGQILAFFGNFGANFGQNRAFSLADRCFPWWTFFFVRTVNFDCSADLSAVRLEMTTIRHDGRLYGLIRWRLKCPP